MAKSFKIVQLFKERSLGPPGSHGAVCRAKCDGLHCAAKIMNEGCYSPAIHHRTSLKKDRNSAVSTFKKLEQEMEYLGTIRHTNLVQYLGVHREHVSGSPVLLMELMDYSLTEYLGSSTHSISYRLQANICLDVAQALSFLHSYGIVHRSLSSNNVLLGEDLSAKICDFGTSKLIDLGLQSSSNNAHIDVYMPPEALSVPAQYSDRTDCFSFGVLIVQILTRLFPSPTSEDSTQTEVERRQHHICMIDLDHPLLSTVLGCLRDKASDRPTAQEICQSIELVKNNDYVVDTLLPGFDFDSDVSERGGTVVANGGSIVQHSMKLELERKDKIILDMKREIAELREQLAELKVSHGQELAQKNWMIAESEIKLSDVNQKLEESEEARATLENQTVAFEKWATQPQALGSVDTKRKIKLEWGEEMNSPFTRDFSRFCSNAVVDGDVVCFKTALSADIYAYDSTEDNWNKLPPCPHVNGYCSLVSINGLLTTVGDYDYGDEYSNRLFSLTALDQKWKKVFPNMPTKRCLTTTVCTKTALIVAGGRGENREIKRTVEVMNTETCRWLTASDLPEPLFCSTAAICGDRLYLFGGKDRYGQSTPAVYACSLSALLKSCKSRLLKSHHPFLLNLLPSSPLAARSGVWTRLADLPVVGSTCVSVHGQILAVGGRELSHQATTTIYIYNASNDSWAPVDHRMSTPRSECFAAVLPDNRLLVAGGYSAAGNVAATAEIATIS